MSGCMGSDKPLIAILMAVYEPRMDWLREQLLSLDAQAYPNLKLYIRDDCSPTVSFEEIQSRVRECIHSFPYEIRRNEENLGSNKTFERLTREADGEYFAYCDQDDIWLPEKLALLQTEMTRAGALLACSDMYVMDGNGHIVTNSITKVRRHHIFLSGARLADRLLFHNFVTGCTMLISVKAAKAAVPFCPYMVHDHYLALWCAEHGTIVSINRPLIRYRVHDRNQTGIMAGVHDKKSYGEVRIDLALNKMLWLKEHFPCGDQLGKDIDEGIIWLLARRSNWNHRGGARTVWKYRRFSPLVSMAELFLKYAPEQLFQIVVHLTRENEI